MSLAGLVKATFEKETRQGRALEKTGEILCEVPGISDFLGAFAKGGLETAHFFSLTCSGYRHRFVIIHCLCDQSDWCFALHKAEDIDRENPVVRYTLYLVPATPMFRLKNIYKLIRKIMYQKEGHVSTAELAQIFRTKGRPYFEVISSSYNGLSEYPIVVSFMHFVSGLTNC
ncbi:hypothetical protein HQ571_02155 [Candidatus Kuenenbacteria bacterium]|nr:hypothetical protein [Candidatus Kuenenbacteria bacterium]